MSIIIKNMSLKDLRKMYGDQDFVSLANDLFNELTKYEIIVPAHFKIEGGKLKSFVKKIEGPNLRNGKVDQKFIFEVVKLYTSLTKYFLKKWSEGGLFLTDINSGDQYVYGTTSDNTKKQIYLVDTDLYFYQGRKGLFLVIRWFIRHMVNMEKKCGCEFLEARSQIKKSDIPITGDIDKFILGKELGPAPLGPALPNFWRD